MYARPFRFSMTEDLDHILFQLGEDHAQWSNAVTPPIAQTSNFCFPDVAAFRRAFEKEQSEPLYTRGVNPTVSLLRKKIAALEGAEDALVWSSGAAAITASVMSVVKQGDHVVCVQHPYSWAKYLLNDYLPKFGVSCSFIDGTSIENFSAAIQENTRLIYLESPNSFTFELQDLKGIAALAKEKNIITICDNSYSGPLAQSPLQFGIDMVIHSATKYLNGHSDVVAGVVCSNKERIQHLLKSEYMTLGSICSPFEAWLILRGLRTLKLRFEHSAKSALVLADKLHAHPKIKSVIYPFHPSFPQFELAKKQMQKGNGLLTIRLHASSIAQVEKFCNTLKYFKMAVSWGGHESLQIPVCTFYKNENDAHHLHWDMIRLYCGLEETETLWNDLQTALAELN